MNIHGNTHGTQAGRLPIGVSKPSQHVSVSRTEEFTTALISLDSTKSTSMITDTNNTPQALNVILNSKPDKEAVSKSLESMLVAQFLGPLFAGSESGFFGSGVQGDITKSLFTDAIAKAITKRGGIGLGKYI